MHIIILLTRVARWILDTSLLNGGTRDTSLLKVGTKEAH